MCNQMIWALNCRPFYDSARQFFSLKIIGLMLKIEK